MNIKAKTKKVIILGIICILGITAIGLTSANALEVSFTDPASKPTQNNIKEAFETADTIKVGIPLDIESEISLKGRKVTLTFVKLENQSAPYINFKASGKLLSGDVPIQVEEPDKWNISADKQVYIVQYVNPYNRPTKVESDSKVIRMNLDSLSGDKKYAFVEYTASDENKTEPIDKIYLKNITKDTPATSGDTGTSEPDDGGGCNANRAGGLTPLLMMLPIMVFLLLRRGKI